MKKNRRSFLQVSGTLAAGSLLLPQFACTSSNPQKEAKVNDEPKSAAPTTSPDLEQFGIQLWTLRDVIPQDPKGVLRQLATFGYHQIESYEGDLGMFWGMKPKEYKQYCDDLGLRTVASHCNIKENFAEKAAQVAEIGIDYLICPWVGPQESMDDWKKIADEFNQCGEICKQNGIRFAYHNHAYSFETIDDVIPQDYLMTNTDADLVDYEMDMYWVVTGGVDPIEYLNKYPNRFRLCHIKDRIKDAPAEEQKASCDLGTGSIDYPKILKVAKEQGMKYYILEQERYDNSTPLKSAQVGATYLKQLAFSS